MIKVILKTVQVAALGAVALKAAELANDAMDRVKERVKR